MTDGREQAIGGHNKPIAIRSLGCDAICFAIHKFLATMVGNRESDFRGAQWIGRLLRLEGDALVGAHAFPVVDDRVQLALKPDGGRVVNLPTKLQLLLLRVPTERNINGVDPIPNPTTFRKAGVLSSDRNFRSSIRIMAFSSLCEYLRAEALR